MSNLLSCDHARHKKRAPKARFDILRLRPKRGYFPSFRCHSGYFFQHLAAPRSVPRVTHAPLGGNFAQIVDLHPLARGEERPVVGQLAVTRPDQGGIGIIDQNPVLLIFRSSSNPSGTGNGLDLLPVIFVRSNHAAAASTASTTSGDGFLIRINSITMSALSEADSPGSS